MGNPIGNVVAILNDTHIGRAHPSEMALKGYEPDTVHANHNAAVNCLVARHLPEVAIFNGDLARIDGTTDDYRLFFDCLSPLCDGGMRAYLTLGNHDNRVVFQNELATRKSSLLIAGEMVVGAKYAALAPTDFANFYIVDSLSRTNANGDPTGRLGSQIREWFLGELDARNNTPAIIVTHHTPRRGGDAKSHAGGLVDTDELWPELVRRSWVKAYFHGHVHDYLLTQADGIWIGSLPASSYHPVGAVSKPGWTLLEAVSNKEMNLSTWHVDGQMDREQHIVWR